MILRCARQRSVHFCYYDYRAHLNKECGSFWKNFMHLCAGIDPVLPKQTLCSKNEWLTWPVQRTMRDWVRFYRRHITTSQASRVLYCRHHEHQPQVSQTSVVKDTSCHRRRSSQTAVGAGTSCDGYQSLRTPVITDTSHHGLQSSWTPPSRTSQAQKYYSHRGHHIHHGRYGQLDIFNILYKTFWKSWTYMYGTQITRIRQL